MFLAVRHFVQFLGFFTWRKPAPSGLTNGYEVFSSVPLLCDIVAAFRMKGGYIMEKDTEDKLGNILNKYDQKKQEAEKEQQRQKSSHGMFLESFDGVINSVIRPTMEEFGKSIMDRGHFCEITQEKESVQPDQKVLSRKSIEMTIYPNSDRSHFSQKGHTPAISFIAEAHGSSIYSHACAMMPGRGGQAGKRKDYKIENITREVVEEEIIHLLDECFGR
jgi:hypothetical protein